MSCAHAQCNAPAEQWGASPTARARHRQKSVGALFMASLKRKGGAVARERAVVVRDRRGAVGGKTHTHSHTLTSARARRHTYSSTRLSLTRAWAYTAKRYDSLPTGETRQQPSSWRWHRPRAVKESVKHAARLGHLLFVSRKPWSARGIKMER